MNFQTLPLKNDYRPKSQNPPEKFFRSVLPLTYLYRRASGYFTSSVFSLFSEEIIEFAKNGGTIELVCSPSLTEEDKDAIEQGYSAVDIANKRINFEVEELLREANEDGPAEFLGTLIKLNVLSLKIGFYHDGKGIFHDKTGYFVDKKENMISFKGSINETGMGWSEYGNFETIEVFKSWVSEDIDRVSAHKIYLDNLWTGNIDAVEVVEFPKASRERLIKISKNSFDEFSKIEVHKNNKEPRELEPHQSKAIENWEANGSVGILQHATGSGKTVTAISAIKSHVDQGKCALVIVPSILLLKQWDKELRKDILDPSIILCGGGHTAWEINEYISSLTKEDSLDQGAIIIAVQMTASKPEFRKKIKSPERMLIVADEVHKLGSENFSDFFEIKIGKRLGLSATPERFGDLDGTERIKDYFGKIILPIFTLGDAVECGRLVRYTYHPQKIDLQFEEQEKWEKYTKQIIYAYSNQKIEDGNKPSEKLKNLLIQRARIIKKAKNKVDSVIDILNENFHEKQHWLVYLEDKDQLFELNKKLTDLGYSPYKYFSEMGEGKEEELNAFISQSGILLSINCLDEGIDIPVISHAVIAASSRNPRQFIQRRGRVLRKHPGKNHAEVFDCLVLPKTKSSKKYNGLLTGEVKRAMEFAEFAENQDACISMLRSWLIELGQSPDEIMQDEEDDA